MVAHLLAFVSYQLGFRPPPEVKPASITYTGTRANTTERKSA